MGSRGEGMHHESRRKLSFPNRTVSYL
uniref:Uncharacterized protein n=1 Tax=Anguilla anguilla TaxID=7936 RepID=A0A0E9R6F3_ANGAN